MRAILRPRGQLRSWIRRCSALSGFLRWFPQMRWDWLDRPNSAFTTPSISHFSSYIVLADLVLRLILTKFYIRYKKSRITSTRFRILWMLCALATLCSTSLSGKVFPGRKIGLRSCRSISWTIDRRRLFVVFTVCTPRSRVEIHPPTKSDFR